MKKLPQTPLLSKIIVLFSCLCFSLYVISIVSPYWLKLRKEVPANPPTMPYPALVRVHMGLYRACKNLKANVPGGVLVIEDWCRSKDAPDWHKTAAFLGGMALASGLAEVVVAVLCVTINKMANSLRLKLVTAGCSALAVGFMIPILVLFDENRKNYKGYHYDLHYDYVLAIIAMVFYFILTLLVLADMYFYRFSDRDVGEERLWTEEKNRESQTRYT